MSVKSTEPLEADSLSVSVELRIYGLSLHSVKRCTKYVYLFVTRFSQDLSPPLDRRLGVLLSTRLYDRGVVHDRDLALPYLILEKNRVTDVPTALQVGVREKEG